MKEYATMLALIMLLIIAILAGAASRIDATLYNIHTTTTGTFEANR